MLHMSNIFGRGVGCLHHHTRVTQTNLVRRLKNHAVSLQTSAPIKAESRSKLTYDGIVFDMDGTLSEAHIDFADMRRRTGIPQGDLFTAMEAWNNPARVQAAMTVILDIEEKASAAVRMKAGLLELLQMLSQRQVLVALVTRNTHRSVDAFFRLVGEEWRTLFSQVLTREFVYVKPDRRLLLHVAEAWSMDPSRILMVGDSVEDIEVGNAAGTASCLVAGGGNEKPGALNRPHPGGIPTFSVASLSELREELEAAVDAQASGSYTQLKLGWPARRAAGEQLDQEGAPPPGLDFLDWMAVHGDLSPAECSFPGMGSAAGGLATCEVPGSSVLHIGCGCGALTKVMASQGMPTRAIDIDVAAARQRGLAVCEYLGPPLSRGSLSHAKGDGPYNIVIISAFQGRPELPLIPPWNSYEALGEVKSVLADGGELGIDSPVPPGTNPAAMVQDLAHHGFEVLAWQSIRDETNGNGGQLRLRILSRLRRDLPTIYS